MKKDVFYKMILSFVSVAFLFCSILLTGCETLQKVTGKDDAPLTTLPEGESHRNTLGSFIYPSADGQAVFQDGKGAFVDYSHTDEGYVMIKVDSTADVLFRVQISPPEGDTYAYPLLPNQGYRSFPLSSGNGEYKVCVMQQVEGSRYVILLAEKINVVLRDEFRPFLYPNQFTWYTDASGILSLGGLISDNSRDDLDFIKNVYHYAIKSIVYDFDKAANVEDTYIPDVEETLATGKGICFDYASVMTALLRSQGIPTKLVVGYSGTAYHAWISVYLEDIGWVENAIYFDGEDWTLMDPTLGANNNTKDVKNYVGDGSNYIAKYEY